MVQDLSIASGARLIPAAALAHVPGLEAGARPVAVSLLPGGTVNRSFRIDTGAGRFVLRLNAIEGDVLGANHEREAQLQRAAAAGGVAPPLIYADSQRRFMISKFIDGRVWQASDLESREGARWLGARLRVLHAIAVPAAAPFDPAARLRDYCARLITALPAESALYETLLQQSEATLALCAVGGRKAAIVHNDLHHSNLIEADRLYLIDWEYAAVADPIFDLACILAYYPHAQPYAQDLLDSAGLGEEASIPMLLAASALYVLLSFLWYRLRRLTCEAAPADLAAEEALLRRLRA
ncbi:MAG TPA: phosphotransferase [Steroidobacteraceae bacterium]